VPCVHIHEYPSEHLQLVRSQLSTKVKLFFYCCISRPFSFLLSADPPFFALSLTHTHAKHDSLSLSLSLFSRTRSFRWPAFALRETKEQYARVSLSPDNAITVYRFSVVRRPEIPTNQLKLTNPNNNETETELFVCDPVARY